MSCGTKAIALCAVFGFLLTSYAVADPTTADRHYTEGNKLLSAADFDGALDAFKKAAQEDPARIELRNEYALLRRIIALRGELASERDTGRWQEISGALRAYYADHALHAEVLAIDEAAYKKLRSPQSAALLAETLLELNRDREAADLLARTEGLPLTGQILHGIALARLEMLADARAKLQALGLPCQPDADLLFHLSRLQALAGDPSGTVTQLTRMFQMVPPDRLTAARDRVRNCADFAALTGTPAFAAALQVQSAVKQSGCSSGPGCGQCPSKSKCASAAAHAGSSGK